MTEHRDTTVAAALRRLDVPDHEPDFWDRLDARLAGPGAGADADPGTGADPATAAPADPQEGHVVELASAPSRRRGLGHPRPALALAAATLVLVALVVGISVLRPGDDESRVDSADRTDEPDQDGAPPTPGEREDGGARAAQRIAAEEAATRWLTALSDGDVEGAHAMLDQTTQAQLPLEAFRDLATGLAEGAAAFHDVSTRHVTTLDDGAPVWVVTFSGEVEREGTVETDAFPVVVVDEDGPRIAFEVTQLEVRPAVGATVDVHAAPGATVVSSVDGSAPTPVDVDAEGRGSFAVEVAGDPASTHVLTVIAVSDGRPAARAIILDTTLEVTTLGLEPADPLPSATSVGDGIDDAIGAYTVRAAPAGDAGLCFEVETGDGVFGSPCLGTPGFGELRTPEGTRLLVANITDPAARSVVVTVDGHDQEVALAEVDGWSARSFALRVDGDIEAVAVLDGAGQVLAAESR